MLKNKDLKKTTNGVLYEVDKTGTDNIATDSDTILAHYKSSLVDKTEFDNYYKRSKLLSIRLYGLLPG
ncbi:MAG: hypothetical protein ACR5K4_04075 [Sodalis sp. (in: enterobacteria)]